MTGNGIRTSFTVTGGAAPAASSDPRLGAAVAQYRSFVVAESNDLVDRTKQFAAAVEAGGVAKAKSLYAPTREPWERIEPVAETLGDLDPKIDAREGDVPAGEWGGFHRIEKALWADGNLDGMAPVANELQADIRKLADLVAHVNLEPAQIA